MKRKSDNLKSAGKNTGESEKINYLRKENAFLKNILNAFPYGIYVKDIKSGEYVFRNEKSKKQTLLLKEKMENETGKKIPDKEKAKDVRTREEKITDSGKITEYTDKSVIKDTTGEKWFRTVKIPLQTINKKPDYLIEITEDISEKISFRDKLTENEKEFEFIFRESPAALLIIDLKSRKIKKVNQSFIKLTELKAGSIKNKTPDEIGIKTDSESKSKLSWYIKSGKKINKEKIRIKYRNKEFTGQVSADVFNYKGKPSLLAVFNDLTDIINTADNLKEKENLLQRILNMTPGIIYVYDFVKRKNIFISNNISGILGYTANEFKNKGSALTDNLLHPDDLKKYNREIIPKLRDISGNEILISELRLKIKNKREYKWMLGHLTVLEKNDAGEVQKILGILSDITVFKNAEKELAQSLEKLDFSKQIVNYGLWEYDKESRKLKTSDEINKIFEIRTTRRLINKKEFLKFIPPEERAFIENIRKNVQEGKTAEIKHRIKLPSGTEKYVYSKIMPVLNEAGKTVKISGISCDVTERTVSEIKLRQLADELYKSNKINEKCLSVITDDLRGPFTGLLGFAAVLENEFGVLSRDDIFKYIKIINASLKTVYNLIENLLQWSRIRTNNLLFNPEKIDLQVISELVKNILKPEADSKKITIMNEIKSGYYAYGDSSMVHSVFQNLLSNSIKYSNESDSVVISAEEKGKHYEISVSDTGVGMKPEVLKNLFNIYEPKTTLGTKNERGAGLGLILCKEYISMHGSKLKLNSEEGIGTAFYFKLKKY